jgi:hypothetical protein
LSAKKSALFVKLPERAVIWDGLTLYQRLLGTEMFRVFQEHEHEIAGDWRRLVCMSLAVTGPERGNVSRALDGMLEAGVVVVGDGTFRLLYSAESVRLHRRPLEGRSGSAPGSLEGRSGSAPGSLEGRSGSAPGSLEGRSGFRSEVSTRNHSTVSGEIEDREIEDRRVREVGSESGPGDQGPTGNPSRLRPHLEELVRAEFFARRVTPQKAPASQWRDGCQTVDDALQLGAYPDAWAAMRAFATRLVDVCAAGKPLGLALQQTPLGEQLKPVAPRRQLSELAMRRLAEGT